MTAQALAAATYARSIVDTVRQPLLLLTGDLQVVTANAAFYERFGGTPDTVEHRPLAAIGNGEWNVPQLAARLGELLPAKSELRDLEVIAGGSTGDPSTLLLSARPLQHPESDVQLILLSIEDVTERRRMSRELAETMRQLEIRNSELQDFAAVASHDLQEPLRKIQAFSDRLTSACGDALPPEGRDYLARIQGAAGRMSTLIHDLLSLTRVTTRGQQFERVDLTAIAMAVRSDLEEAIARSAATVNIASMPAIDADPTQMRQLLQNLIGNAIKFRGAAPCVITVSCRREPDGSRLTVEDNGIGFALEHAERIFDPFQRLHGRSAYEGTGIGLALCRRIMLRHGGTIHATSRAEGGARFVATFPEAPSQL